MAEAGARICYTPITAFPRKIETPNRTGEHGCFSKSN
jgi:hypothetical protein